MTVHMGELEVIRHTRAPKHHAVEPVVVIETSQDLQA
jgi:hypothetical protein